jgi:hypothetical protein
MKKNKLILLYLLFAILFFGYSKTFAQNNGPWPSVKKEMRPWTRWWWMGSAVDEKNLDRVLGLYSKAGFGGVEITPIYGAKDFESRYIKFLSPQWMSMLNFTVKKATSVGMGVDMNTGTGWPFGGPQVTAKDAAGKVIIQLYTVEGGKSLNEKIILKDVKQVDAGARLQAVTAYGSKGEIISLENKVDNIGNLNWTAPAGNWQLYAAFAGKTLQLVKRAAPGGEGLVMNHLNKTAVDNYLKRFDSSFDGSAHGVRAFFNDSYEVYNANWTPDLFDEFKKRRGYDLRLYLRELQSTDSTEKVSRVKTDYRETISQLLLENMAVNWTNWAHKYKAVTKYQAHGSPGNLLDLYAAADIPECEAYFGLSYFPIPGLRHDTTDVINPGSNPNIFKFATSAAHVYGKPLASSETFVWLTDHFKTSLSQCKPEVEKLFLAGINHVFYHGTTYSPEDIPFPGWQFYASSNFTPSNSLWPHVNALNNYIARCQSVLQAGKADNELLIYWPVYDAWANPKGTDMQLSMHNVKEWLTETSFNEVISRLQGRGYLLDYISDKMLKASAVNNGSIQVSPVAPRHKALIVPACGLMPVETFEKIIASAREGATVIFQDLPKDVPGNNDLEIRRNKLKNLITSLKFKSIGDGPAQLNIGKGKIFLSNDIEACLNIAGIKREELTGTGLAFIRRDMGNGKYYYLVKHTAKTIDENIDLNGTAGSVVIMDPLTTGFGAASSSVTNGKTNVHVQLRPGESWILRTYNNIKPAMPKWKYLDIYEPPMTKFGEWDLHFTNGGPELPADQRLSKLISWTDLLDTKAGSFSGTGVYSTTFKLPVKNAGEYILDLGVVDESAHVWINGQDAGIIWSIPFTARIGKFLRQGNNTIKIEVANLMANRIRDMDIKGIKWRNYHEINFVNINYRPFDASKWKPQPSGLLGPVTITPVN